MDGEVVVVPEMLFPMGIIDAALFGSMFLVVVLFLPDLIVPALNHHGDHPG